MKPFLYLIPALGIFTAAVSDVDAAEHTHDMQAMDESTFIYGANIEQLEWRDTDPEKSLHWDANIWAGDDINRLRIASQGERADGKTERVETQLLYSRAVSSYWDFTAGVRSDIKPEPDQQWLALGIKGLAPYFFDIDAQLFISSYGQYSARVSAKYEILLTQRLILTPEIEISLYREGDNERGIGSGLASADSGLRLRYEFVREFAPYIGVHHEQRFGDSADFARATGNDTSDTVAVIGFTAWY